MKKIIFLLLFSGILVLAISFLGGNICLAALSGTTEASDTTVAPGEQYKITVRGESDAVVEKLSVDIYLEGKSSPINSGSCSGSLTCAYTRTYSQSTEGDYTYYGMVSATGETSFRTNSVTVEVTSQPPSAPGTNGGVSGEGGFINFQNPLQYETFGELIDAIIKFIFYIAVVIAPLMVIIGAFYILTAGGDPKKIGTGKNIIIYTLIGLAIILLARGLIAMIESVIGVKIGG